MVIEERKAVNCVHNCILCGVCISKCPDKAHRIKLTDEMLEAAGIESNTVRVDVQDGKLETYKENV